MNIHIHHHHHIEADDHVVRLLRGHSATLTRIEELIMAISPQVQSVLDAIAANTNLVTAVDAALKAEATQITGLQNQVKALQDQIAAGGTLSADDIAGLAAGLQQLSDTNTKLQSDVPAGT
jgi:uncharacterized phage infection (PIP) family protein YhgE